MSQKEKRIKEDTERMSLGPLDLEDGVQLPNIMGWFGGLDYIQHRARDLEDLGIVLGSKKRDTSYRKFQGDQGL